MVWVKESPKYAIQYNMNFAKLPIVRMVMLLDKYRRGTLDMNDEIEKMFYQFMMNGGETGFSRMADIDEHKKEIKKMLKAANEKIPAHVVRECMATWIGEVGRGIEMRARFAAFVTSRNAGRTIDRSIWDAKEISVNFNKKGAGDKFLGAEGQTMLGNVAAGVSGAGRAGYIFWNAALQGTFGNFLKYAMRHPGKMGTVVASWYGLAMLVTALASAGGDDDDDSYYDIPEHTRRQNLIVKGPGNAWIKIPLPIEYRAVYAMGELTGSSLFHNEKLEVSDVLAQMSQLLPVDMMEGTKALWPSSVKPMVEVSNNESWYGSPIWKDTPYNKYMPNWTKAYKSANKDLVNLLGRCGGKALGFSGIDGDLITCKKLNSDVDLGYVGEITNVNTEPLKLAIEAGYIPVVASIGTDKDHQDSYNINADTCAAKVAAALKAEKLLLLTDVPGVLMNPKDNSSLISTLRLCLKVIYCIDNVFIFGYHMSEALRHISDNDRFGNKKISADICLHRIHRYECGNADSCTHYHSVKRLVKSCIGKLAYKHCIGIALRLYLHSDGRP